MSHTFNINLVLSIILFSSSQQVFAVNKYGAIAYSSSTGAYGYSYNNTSKYSANRRAIRSCRIRASKKDCKVVIGFKNACGALAKGYNRGFGYGSSVQKTIAKHNALNVCRRYTNRCRVIRTVCTDR
jgi:hypothetical protein